MSKVHLRGPPTSRIDGGKRRSGNPERRCAMEDQIRRHEAPLELTREELDGQTVAELAERDAMSLVNLNLAAPINLAAALNVLSDGAIAAAGAEQNTPIDQGI